MLRAGGRHTDTFTEILGKADRYKPKGRHPGVYRSLVMLVVLAAIITLCLMGEQLVSVLAVGSTPGAVVGLLAGLFNLEKDRTRRYGSASEFAADIRRHLKHEPVLARPPSVTYRLRKFVRRHRVGVATPVLILVIGLTGTTVGMVRARQAERRTSAEAAKAEKRLDADYEAALPLFREEPPHPGTSGAEWAVRNPRFIWRRRRRSPPRR